MARAATKRAGDHRANVTRLRPRGALYVDRAEVESLWRLVSAQARLSGDLLRMVETIRESLDAEALQQPYIVHDDGLNWRPIGEAEKKYAIDRKTAKKWAIDAGAWRKFGGRNQYVPDRLETFLATRSAQALVVISPKTGRSG